MDIHPHKCRECAFYEPLPKTREYDLDGTCNNTRHVGKGRKTPYYVTGAAHACFDSEWPDGQLTIEG